MNASVPSWFSVDCDLLLCASEMFVVCACIGVNWDKQFDVRVK